MKELTPISRSAVPLAPQTAEMVPADQIRADLSWDENGAIILYASNADGGEYHHAPLRDFLLDALEGGDRVEAIAAHLERLAAEVRAHNCAARQ